MTTTEAGRAAAQTDRTLTRWLVGVGIAFALAGASWAAHGVVFDRYYVPSASMEPNIEPGDRIEVRTVGVDAGRGDVIVFEAAPDENVPARLSRVIGLPGDEVEARDGQVFRNGSALDEGYLDADETTTDFGPEEIPEGTVFVLSDNRGNSRDSRVVGPIEQGRIIGIVTSIDLPIAQILLGTTALLGLAFVSLAARAVRSRRARPPTER